MLAAWRSAAAAAGMLPKPPGLPALVRQAAGCGHQPWSDLPAAAHRAAPWLQGQALTDASCLLSAFGLQQCSSTHSLPGQRFVHNATGVTGNPSSLPKPASNQWVARIGLAHLGTGLHSSRQLVQSINSGSTSSAVGGTVSRISGFSSRHVADGGGGSSSGSSQHAAGDPSGAAGPQPQRKVPLDAREATARARRIAPLVGAAAGIFGSLVGVGGGVLIVPALVGACPGISQRLVSGTSLVAVLATAAAATKTYSTADVVDPAAAALIGAAAVCTAPLGAWLTTRLNAQVLRRMLGWFLVSVALLVPLKALLLAQLDAGAAGAAAAIASWQPSWALPPAPKAAFLAASGALAGCATGLLGVGGGTVVTPLLAAAGGMPQAAVVGTSLLAMLPPCTVALVQHARLGNVDWRLAAGLAGGAALGSWAGSAAAVGSPPGLLEAAFSVGMLFLGAKTLRSGGKIKKLGGQ